MAHRSAWVFQDPKEVKRVGARKASWGVGWREPDGSRRQTMCGSGSEGKKKAFRRMKKIEAELLSGCYVSDRPVPWSQFRDEYEKNILATLGEHHRLQTTIALGHFERIVKPRVVGVLGNKSIDKYISERKQERGQKPGSVVSPATLNKELRYLKSVFGVAHEWGYLRMMPNFRKRRLREPEKLARFVSADHFALIYASCDVASKPIVPNVKPGEWWRALVVTACLTGWRINELLTLRKDDVDMEAGTAITRYGDNKGKRDGLVHLHPIILDHLAEIETFGELMFPWPHNRRHQWREFARIQKAAGIHVPCREGHEHTEACHFYGFHDFRRTFATENASKLSPLELQSLMRHRSFTTTQRYINMAKQNEESPADRLFVPPSLQERKNA